MGSSSNFSPVLSFTCLLPFPEAFASTQSFLACPLLLRRNRHWLLEASCFLLNISHSLLNSWDSLQGGACPTRLGHCSTIWVAADLKLSLQGEREGLLGFSVRGLYFVVSAVLEIRPMPHACFGSSTTEPSHSCRTSACSICFR